MDRIKEGIIEVDGVVLSGETTIEDLEKIDIDKAVQRDHAGGFYEVIFNHPIENDGVKFEVSMRIEKHDDARKLIMLEPKFEKQMRNVLDESREEQEVCEEWLKRNMGIEPTRDTEDGIFYDFPWGHVYSAAAEHINFGHLEGCIQITFGDDYE